MEVPWSSRRPAPRVWLYAAAVSATISAIAILLLDQPIARWLAGYRALDLWARGLEILEWAIGLPLFPWTLGIGMVLAMIVTSSVPRWRAQAPAWMLIASTHILSRIVVLQLKLV